MKSQFSYSGLDRLVEEYLQYLTSAAGLARQTCAQRERYVRKFLLASLSRHPRERSFHQWSAPRVLEYLTTQSVGCKPLTLKCQAGALRSFFRFLIFTGRAPAGLDQALPPIRGRSATLPVCLSPNQLDKLLKACQRRSPVARRDEAIVLLAARLGLRAREIAQLHLEDVDWPAQTICLRQTKGLRSRLLPLSCEIAKRLIEYLKNGRPKTGARQLFLCLHRPRPRTSGAVSDVVTAAFKRAGLQVSRPGPHLLRHTLATHLIRKGASLKAIADLLGHRSLNTTTTYAKVNGPMLAQVTQPWPEDKR